MLVQVSVGCKLGQMTRVSRFMLDTGLAQNVSNGASSGPGNYSVDGDYIHIDPPQWEALESLLKSEGVSRVTVRR